MGNEGSQPIKYGETLENDVKVTWKQISAEKSPSGRDGHCACSIGNKCFVFGGVELTDDGTAQESNKMLVFALGRKFCDQEANSYVCIVLCINLTTFSL